MPAKKPAAKKQSAKKQATKRQSAGTSAKQQAAAQPATAADKQTSATSATPTLAPADAARPENVLADISARLDTRENLLRAYPWVDKILPFPWRCPIRVLLVADGALDFSANAFGMTELLNALQTPSLPWSRVRITTAHRSMGVADIQNFRFDVTPPAPHDFAFSTKTYDQVWLFGFNTAGGPDPLSDGELAVLSKFMANGGGVFATGDHEDLGFAMCAHVPRVRSMRLWYFGSPDPSGNPNAPEGFGVNRIDTLREGLDTGFQFSDQSDIVPQEVRPRYYMDASNTASYPHPVLSVRGGGAVKVMPDHPHEGICVVPKDLTRTYSFGGSAPADEYPHLPLSRTRLAPEVIAISTSAGGYLTDAGKPAVNPRCFGTVGAYDGHRVGVGRVVVDATWHHFININLNGEGSGDPNKRGFYDAMGNPTPDYLVIKQYFRNIVNWLSPRPLLRCWYFEMLVALRYMWPLIEEIRPLKEPTPEEILAAGLATRNAISNYLSPAFAASCAHALLDDFSPEVKDGLERLLDPFAPAGEGEEGREEQFGSQQAVDAILGGAILQVAANLSHDPHVADREAAKLSEGGGLEELVRGGVSRGLNALGQTVERSGGSLRELSGVLSQAK